MEKVEWRPVVGSDRHWVSNIGGVKSKHGRWGTNHVCKLTKTKKGYLVVQIGPRLRGVHQLVAEAFLGKRPKDSEVNHKNGIKDTNRVENLEWSTPKANSEHASKTGLLPTTPVIGVNIETGKYLELSAVRHADEHGIASQNIHKCLSGQRPYVAGYIWVRKNEKRLIAERLKHARLLTSRKFRPVRGMCIETGERVEFQTTFEVTEAGFFPYVISQCVRGGLKSTGGYVWQHLSEFDGLETKRNLMRKKLLFPVLGMHLETGEEIIFNSDRELTAAGFRSGNIWKVLKGLGKSAGGYSWETLDKEVTTAV